MKVLLITQHNPFGTKGGGQLASHAYLRAFADCFNGNLDLICADLVRTYPDHDDPQIKLNQIIYAPDRTKLQKFTAVFTGYLNRYIEFTRHYIKHHHSDYKVVVFDQNGIAGPLVKYAKSYGLKAITIHHNLEREYFADNTHGLYRRLFLPHVIKWEKIAYRHSDVNLYLTEQDKIAFGKCYGETNAQNIVLGTFEYNDYQAPQIKDVESKSYLTFAITGSMCNYQTVDGVKFFFDSLYEHLPQECNVIIAGRDPNPYIIEECSKRTNVTLVSNPSDMNTIIQQADVYICPTRIGGGLKLRVMDGLRNGLPVILHSCSARGFDMFYNQECFKVYNDGIEFKDSVSYIMEYLKAHTDFRSRVQEIYKNNFSYASGLKRIEEIVKIVM